MPASTVAETATVDAATVAGSNDGPSVPVDAGLSIFGDASFADTVGYFAPLTSLTVNGAAALNGGSVTTNAAGFGTQTYQGAVTLKQDAALSASAGTPALVTFDSTVDATAAGAQALTVTGSAVFGGVTVRN